MDSLWTALKTVAIMAAMILVCIGLPIWGASGSLSRAWQAVKEYVLIMGAFVLIGGGAGLLVALLERL